jgi:tripartite-type tricarboxylate transporter receptor subunit TctC
MMKARRRDFLSLAAAAVALPRLSRDAWALDYPARPVRLIVATGAGGSPDIVARLIGQWLSEKLGQPFVVDNRPGASTNIGTELALKGAAGWRHAAARHVFECNQPGALSAPQLQFHARRRAGGEYR